MFFAPDAVSTGAQALVSQQQLAAIQGAGLLVEDTNPITYLPLVRK